MEANTIKESIRLDPSIAAGGIRLYTIENKTGARMIVSNLGCAVVALFVPDKDGQLRDVVLGYDNISDYQTDEFYLGTVVGRYANRISSGRVVIDNQSYDLFTKPGGYHQHGGKVGFNKKIFSATPFRNTGASGIVFRYTSPHLEEGFPGQLDLEVVYTFSDNNSWTVEYRAVSSETTLINLTQHSYFNLSGEPLSGIDDHELQIHAATYLPVNELQVPTGELRPVKDSPFDFTRFKNIGTDIHSNDPQLLLSAGYDHSFVLEASHTASVKAAAVACSPVSGIKLEVATTEPAIHFYSGNFLSNVKGKYNQVYQERSGFCLETQHFPDAPKHSHFPGTVLRAGEQFYSKTVFSFSIA